MDFLIDLPTALRLAGANNLHIALAAERVEEAYADVAAAKSAWIPSLNGGVIYNKHDGRIQATEGDVVEVSRGSLYVGGGVGLGSSPLNGGSGGPARMFVDLSLAEVLFEPLAARQHADAAGANEIAVFNDTLLRAALAYEQLVRAQARADILADGVKHAERLARITDDFARVGEGYRADAERAAADLAQRRRELLRGQEEVEVASAQLAGVLRLDPATKLSATDSQAIPLRMIEAGQLLHDLIGQAIAARPEVGRYEALLGETSTRTKKEHWRPWLPHLYAGFTGGGFGGNGNSQIESFADRTDFDVAAIWQLENFGFGNHARQRREDSRHRQAHLTSELARDVVAEEVTRSYHRVPSRQQQIDAAGLQVEAAQRALSLNFDGIRGGVLRPIEAQQAIRALVDAQLQQLDAVLDYNAAQFELLRAIGLPPQAGVEPVGH
jgi:outer membrane protein TolC